MTLPSLPACPNPACEQPHVIRNGSSNGRRRYHCRGCDRFFGETAGTPMYRLHTPAAEVAQALLVVMRRGSLRAAEEITGHKYVAILRRAYRQPARSGKLGRPRLVVRARGALDANHGALTRKTHAFAKRDATWDALVGLQLFDHNFHEQTLAATPFALAHPDRLTLDLQPGSGAARQSTIADAGLRQQLFISSSAKHCKMSVHIR